MTGVLKSIGNPLSDLTRKIQKELNSGVISIVVLQTILQSKRPMYGYEIARGLRQYLPDTSELPMNQGALYPVLRALEKQGLLDSHSAPSETGPPRRYYQVNAVGKKTLGEWIAVWRATQAFVDSVIGDNHAGIRHCGNQATAKEANR